MMLLTFITGSPESSYLMFPQRQLPPAILGIEGVPFSIFKATEFVCVVTAGVFQGMRRLATRLPWDDEIQSLMGIPAFSSLAIVCGFL